MSLAQTIQRSHRDREDWKYTNLEKLLAKATTENTCNVSYASKSDDERARLVFINGVMHAKMSNFGSVPSCILMGDVESGYQLTIGEQTCLVTQPIELVFAQDERCGNEVDLRFSIDIGCNGRLTLLETHLPCTKPTTIQTDIVLRDHAKFLHGKTVSNGVHIATTTARAAAGAYYNNFTLLRGGLPVRNEIHVQLEGEQAQAALNGAMLARGHQHIDTTTCVTHSAPNCTSRQVYKTVLDEQSQGVFQGKIIVSPDAQKSDGYQLSRALLLSDQAEMDAKPQLEIYADDVKCSHGSTIGDLDEEAMFYLRSRGLNEEQARKLLIEAFIAETLTDVRVDAWREIFRREIEEWTSR